MTGNPDPTPLITSIPGVCGGHAIVKGRRWEVSNVVMNLSSVDAWTPEQWIAEFALADWITPEEVLDVLRYCRDKQCQADGLTCCHCTLNPEEGPDPNDPGEEPVNGWELAAQALERLGKE